MKSFNLFNYTIINSFYSRRCWKRSREPSDPELGLMTSQTTDHDNAVSDEEIIFEKKAAAAGKKKSKSKLKPKVSSPAEQIINYTTHPPTTLSEVPQDTPLMPVSAATATPSTEMWLVNETESLTATCPSITSPVSETSTWTPNETPPSTPYNTSSLTSESDTWTFSKEDGPQLTTPYEAASEENLTISDAKVTTFLPVRDAPSNSTSMGTSCSPKGYGGNVPIETNTTNSSTESCKTPVAPLNKVIITIKDEEEVKLVLESSNKCSCGKLLYMSQENSMIKGTADASEKVVTASECDNKNNLLGSERESSSGELSYSSDHVKMNATADEPNKEVISCELPVFPPAVTPPRDSTDLRLGKHTREI